MGEKIIYINNVDNMPDIDKKQWILKKSDKIRFIYNLSTKDTIWFVIIKAFKKDIYYGKLEIIIFDNINKIDENEKITTSIDKSNRLII
jgi:hypothetical protein